MKKTLLITGGSGFVGSNLAVYLKGRLSDFEIICFDNLVRTGSELNTPRLNENGIKFIKGDVRNKQELLSLPKIDLILECSAEPSVLAAYDDPQYTIDTNLIGTINCLELAKRDKAKFFFLSTSRVYPIEDINAIPFEELETRFDWKRDVELQGCSYDGITEKFPLMGVKSLYGSTKLCSEHIILEFHEMFSLKTIINRFGIIAGPWQMGKIDQGIIGYWIAQHKFGRNLKYIGFGGEGKQVRDALHIDDACELVLAQISELDKLNGQIFNVGGGRKNSFSLMELTQLVQRITKQKTDIQSEEQDRKLDIRIYITDNSKVSNKIAWNPKKNVEEIIFDMNEWMNKHLSSLEKIFI